MDNKKLVNAEDLMNEIAIIKRKIEYIDERLEILNTYPVPQQVTIEYSESVDTTWGCKKIDITRNKGYNFRPDCSDLMEEVSTIMIEGLRQYREGLVFDLYGYEYELAWRWNNENIGGLRG